LLHKAVVVSLAHSVGKNQAPNAVKINTRTSSHKKGGPEAAVEAVKV
jgi:hypothetical protein